MWLVAVLFGIGFLNKLGMGGIVTTFGGLAICAPFQACWRAMNMLWTLLQSIGVCRSLCTTCGNCCTKLACLKAPFLALLYKLKDLLLYLSSKLGGKAKDIVSKRGEYAKTITTSTIGMFGYAKNVTNTVLNATKKAHKYIADKSKVVNKEVLPEIKKGEGDGDDGHQAEGDSTKIENKEEHEVVDKLKDDIDSKDSKGDIGEFPGRDDSLDDKKTSSHVVNKPIEEESVGSLLDYVYQRPSKPQSDKEKGVEDEEDETVGSLPKVVNKIPSKPQMDEGEETKEEEEEDESSSKPTYSTQGKKMHKKKKTKRKVDMEQLTSLNTPQQAINANLFQVQQPFNNGLMMQDPNMMSIYDPQQLYSPNVAQTMPGLYNSNPMLLQFPNAIPQDQLALYDSNMYPTTNMNLMPFQNQMQGGPTMYVSDPLMQLPPPMPLNYDMNMPSSMLAQQQYANPTPMYNNVAYNNPLYGTIGPQGAQSLPQSSYELPTSYPPNLVQQPLPLAQDMTMYNSQIPYVTL